MPLAGSVSAADVAACPPASVSVEAITANFEVAETDCADTICSFCVRADSEGSFASSRTTSEPVTNGAPSVVDWTVMPAAEVPASL